MKNRILVAVVGSNINYSLSPLIHSYFAKQNNMLVYYVPLSLSKENFNKENILNLFKNYNFAGLNITYPYKKDILNFVDFKDKVVQEAGSANTVYFENNVLKLGNFDGLGCYYSFTKYLHLNLSTKNILFIGFGSTTRSILNAFKSKNVNNITIANRTESKVTEYIKKNNLSYGLLNFNNLNSNVDNFDIVINTTSLPLYEIINFKDNKKTLFYDINYSQQNYIKMLELESKGIKYIDGIPMLCHQAAFAFEKWFGVLPLVDEKFISFVYKNVDSWFNRSYCKW